ncbi:MAG TPA: nuclear transport factor 2 family protein [Acidimicrobiia bacterium]
MDAVEELARRLRASEYAAVLEMFHPDVRVQQPSSLPHGGWHEGRTAVDAMGATFGTYWERTITDPRVVTTGDGLVMVTTQTWTAKATGRVATVDVVELFSFTDGMVSEIRVFQQDTHLLLGTLEDA